MIVTHWRPDMFFIHMLQMFMEWWEQLILYYFWFRVLEHWKLPCDNNRQLPLTSTTVWLSCDLAPMAESPPLPLNGVSPEAPTSPADSVRTNYTVEQPSEPTVDSPGSAAPTILPDDVYADIVSWYIYLGFFYFGSIGRCRSCRMQDSMMYPNLARSLVGDARLAFFAGFVWLWCSCHLFAMFVSNKSCIDAHNVI